MVRKRSEKIETHQIDFHATNPDTAPSFPSCHSRRFIPDVLNRGSIHSSGYTCPEPVEDNPLWLSGLFLSVGVVGASP